MNQLVTLAHGAHAVVWHRPIEAHPTVNQIIQEVQAFAIEVSLSPIPQVGVSSSLHCQLRLVVTVGEIQREGVEMAPEPLK